tara:strand:+ start:38 stop:535 length:498 start_codon:yes stop_codon:yes gene_type:complete
VGMNLKIRDCLGCKQKLSPSNFYGTKSNLNYLYKCPNSNCGIFFWHQDVLKEFDLNDSSGSDQNMDIERNIIKKLKIPKGYGRSVYVLKLSEEKGDKKEFVYVGETGNHPLRRYLNHLRGHKKGKYGKRYPTYLLDFELSVQDSKQREKDLAKELKSLYEVKGGH